MFDVSAKNVRTGREVCEQARDMADAQDMAARIRARRLEDGTPAYAEVHIDPHLFGPPEGEEQTTLF